MKRNFFLLVFALLLTNLCYSQVGINTKNPQGIFHVDPKGNTNGVNNVSDDLLIDSKGNVGLGTVSPQAKVHIKSGTKDAPEPGFLLNDGTQGATRVLTSDASGNASWVDSRATGFVFGTFGSGIGLSMDSNYSGTVAGYTVVSRPNNTFVKSSGQITLTKGTWWVKVALFFGTIGNTHDMQAWVRTTLSDDETVGNTSSSKTQYSKDLRSSYSLASNLIWQNAQGGVIYGSFLLDNTSDKPKTYYLMAGWFSGYGTATNSNTVWHTGNSTSSENAIIAYRIG